MSRGYFTITIGGEAFADPDDGVFDHGVSGGPILETVPMFGAAAAKHLHLGNAAIARSFTVTHEHATAAAAVAYMQNAPALWNGVDDVVIALESGGSITLTAARIEVVVTQRVGVTTISELTITAGATEITPS